MYKEKWIQRWDLNYKKGYSMATDKVTADQIIKNNINYSRTIFGIPIFETYLYPNWRSIENTDTLLEIGCGDGWNALTCFDKCDKYIGIDISKEAIKEANKRFEGHNNNVSFIPTTNILSLNKKFDLIFSITVFQHIPREFTKSYINDAKKILNPEGVFIFNVLSGKNHNNMKCILNEDNNMVCSPNIGYSKESIIKLCNDAGFTNVECFKQDVGPDNECPALKNLPYYWYWVICKH